MKKYLFLFAIALMAFTVGCEKSDDTPTPPSIIDGIELPVSNPDSPTFAGSPVTIKGKGFTAESEIWLRVAVKSGEDVKATVTAFTETSITFTTPDVEGSQSVVLKQDGKEQVLGEMFLAKAKELADAKFYSFRNEYNETNEAATQVVSEINKTTGELTQIKTLTELQSLINVVAIDKTVYGISDSGTTGVVWFNTDTKASGVIAESLDSPILGAINGKLHALILSNENLSLVKINTETGATTEKANFGAFQIAGYDETDVYSEAFTYNSKSNTIYIQAEGYSTTTEESVYPVVSLDLESKKILSSTTLIGGDGGDYEYYFFERDEEIYINQSEYREDIVGEETVDSGSSTIYKLNQTDLTFGDKITEYSDQIGWDLIYDEKDDILYLDGSNNYFDTYSFATKESKRINTTDEIGSFVMIR